MTFPLVIKVCFIINTKNCSTTIISCLLENVKISPRFVTF